MTTVDKAQLHAHFDPTKPKPESETVQAIITKLGLIEHPEGGYFAETDRDELRVPNSLPASTGKQRRACTTIHYLLTPKSPLGALHRNKARTVHTLHKGRGRYVIVHADEVATAGCPLGYSPDETLPEDQRWSGKARVEVFTVGQNVLAGEKLQWIVEGGKYKTSFLLADDETGVTSEEGLLISETVVPGFEYEDHDFMTSERFESLIEDGCQQHMRWMVRSSN
ncbi:uncharacterized protein MYCFIDRAFT_26189 [Pseudocercospora fijiensis CIRAD86]|uniref:DUF985 domain-containing protein n=1 Tax=Pseudocercospora fijiensis (strain CIRAD86) TaxID=383855 RepID=N1Q8C7_PSEFD|nr:uncharacterized protein MYCFIDRAFT_26189 [Pseudocercospora fijiensis CIRAD86]EME88061.1 hypothetical protein MYCFIDRAFT_26189 [Pseudocercospora fijiensis CIRAD86]